MAMQAVQGWDERHTRRQASGPGEAPGSGRAPAARATGREAARIQVLR